MVNKLCSVTVCMLYYRDFYTQMQQRNHGSLYSVGVEGDQLFTHQRGNEYFKLLQTVEMCNSRKLMERYKLYIPFMVCSN